MTTTDAKGNTTTETTKPGGEGKDAGDTGALAGSTYTSTVTAWLYTSSFKYTGGTEIGTMSATDTAENATKLVNTYKNSYLYNANYTAD